MRRIMEKKAAGMKAKERILAALLSTALLLSAMPPVSAMAKSPAAPVEGQIQSSAAQPGGQTPVLTDVTETIPETADNAAQSCICQTQCIPAAGETPAVIDSVCPVCAPDGADLDGCLGKPANRSLGDPKTSTTLVVTFGSNGSGGASITDNDMKNAVEAALNQAGGKKPDFTTIQLTGDATEITGWNWKYLINLYMENSDWSGLTTLDLSGMGSLTNVKNEKLSYKTIFQLTSVNLPSSLTTIGAYAFYDCTGLTSVSLPKGLTTIGDHAFASCTGLAGMMFPESIQTIKPGAFDSGSGLLNFEVNDNNLYFTTKDGVLYDKAKTTLLFYPPGRSGDFTVPDGVTAIEDRAFASCRLSGVNFPEGLQTIGEFAFSGSRALKKTTFPDSLQTIGGRAFLDCTGLKEITFPENLQIIGESAFYDCTSLSSLDFLGDAPPIVGDYAFYNVGSTGVIYYPEGANGYMDTWKNGIGLGSGWMLQPATLTVLFDSNGSGGNSLDDNEMKTAVEAALVLARMDKTKITTIKLTGSARQITNHNWMYLRGLHTADSGWDHLISLDLSEMGSLIQVDAAGYSKYAATKFTSAAFPSSLQTIGEHAFQNCGGLISVTFPADAQLKTIGDDAFASCAGLTSVSFPKGLQTIGKSAFASCAGLTNVSLPESLQTIGDNAFFSCTGLEAFEVISNNPNFSSKDGVLYKAKSTLLQYPIAKSGTAFTVPDEVSAIGDSAFESCGLTSVSFPESLRTIGDSAFASCGDLTGVSFPEGLETIEAQSFSNCGSLKAFEVETDNLYFLSKDGVLYNKVNNTLLQYPIAKSGTSFNVPDGVTAIGDYAFDSCGNLTSVSFPESLQTIGNNAFASCGSLTSVSFPESLQTIGSSVFESCASLTSVRFPESLQTIGVSVFESCTSLTSVIFPANAQLQTIGASAFASCSSLEEITFPASLSVIGFEAFAYCGNLSSLTFLRDAPAFSHFSAFTGIASAGVIYYPAGSEKYTEAWKKDKLVLGPDWKLAPAYRLEVEHGAGDGTYGADVRVTVKADTPPSGQVFDKWVSSGGRFDNANSATTTFTMPAAHATVTATYKDGTPPPGHTHFFDSAWRYDNNNHWHECTAGDGARADEAAHTASEWITDKAAAKTEAGSRHKECTVCHYVMQTESIAPTGPTDITVDGAPFTVTINESTIPQTGDTANPLPWLLAMLAALTGGAALLLYRKCRCTKRRG
ncbi:leucine-rich repeat protein [Lachnospiraceae bacterium ASD3451]|uniref:leucine-rich repeat protein n=1 Tax=Diplocloster agilis TaxID=2850323 RepID=UPI001D9BDFD5|nr:leucine-rich repeat protein [Diplocloster agilis]MBU9745772.1 leucine-rich repeat protein [Diplocloster agilis]